MNEMATITLGHGGGGQLTGELISNVFHKHLRNLYLMSGDDAAILPPTPSIMAFSTDGFIVKPWRFPGGDIGKLSICGTVNDLACMGARPKFMSVACIIEEGFAIADLEAITRSMAETAQSAGVMVVTGDTKVVDRGQADGIYITTTGIGERILGAIPSGRSAREGDVVIVTGDIGRHGAAILVARGDFGLSAEISSDCAPLWSEAEAIFRASRQVHVVRDATRGGVGTVLHEIATQSNVGVELDAPAIPVSEPVRGVCELLGLEPLYLACEGRLVVILPESDAHSVLSVLSDAVVIGRVVRDHPQRVVLNTALGTQTLLPPPTGELLPRIC